MPAPRPNRAERVELTKGRLTAAPDVQEERALTEAEEALRRVFPDLKVNLRSIAAVAISGWIVSRSRQTAGIRLAENLAYNLGDSRLRGFAEAALPSVGETLAALPADVPFFDLEKEQVVDVIVAAVQGAQAAAVAAKESLSFAFDDPLPDFIGGD
jgi:hypothetical protein